MNPEGSKSGSDTAFSVSELVSRETDELLELVNEDRMSDEQKLKQETLKALVRHTFMCNPHHYPHRCTEQSFKRDGTTCLLTQTEFRPFDAFGIYPSLAHIIPDSVYAKVCILEPSHLPS